MEDRSSAHAEPTLSLRGIISTNDDPLRCDKCSGLLPLGKMKSFAHPCCGKMLCAFCLNGTGTGRSCPACGTDFSPSGSKRLLKKNAKKDHPWAQHYLARLHQLGQSGMVQSDFEAVRWFRKAASSGHPWSMLQLGHLLCVGSGCDQDLTMAVEYAERVMGAHNAFFAEDACTLLVHVAEQCFLAGNSTRAMSMLSPLAESGHPLAMYKLSFVIYHDGDHPTALKWLEEAFIKSNSANDHEHLAAESAYQAVKWSIELRNDPRAKFWLVVTSKRLRVLLSNCGNPKEIVQFVSAVRRGLRKIRNTCGACGAPLHGAMRKKCGGCKTYCYCNRDCQKAHWNRSEGGHREQCKGAIELKAKMKEARKKGVPE